MTDSYDWRLKVRGTGETVVLVPGMDGTGELFYRQVPLLAREHRVVTYALRDTADRMDELVDDLARVVDAASPSDRSAVIVGESFGGTLALSFALAHPGRVRELVVLNSFPHFTPQQRLRLARIGLAMLPWGAMGLVRRLTAFRLHSPHTHHAEIRQFIRLTASATQHGYRNRLTVLSRYDVRDRLRDITAPVLFLAAERDHLIPSVQQASLMASAVPGATMRILEGHGHICLIAPGVDLGQILTEWRRDRGRPGVHARAAR